MKYLILLSLSFVLFACDNTANKTPEDKKHTTATTESDDGHYGKVLSASESFETLQLVELLTDTNLLEVKLEGKIEAVCQMSGCWIDLFMGESPLYVTFEDEAFTLPKDVAGKQIIVEGLAKKEIISIDYLKRQAKGEGKSEAEINAISEPQFEYSFVAKGVQIKE